jgi:hypothetical protein
VRFCKHWPRQANSLKFKIVHEAEDSHTVVQADPSIRFQLSDRELHPAAIIMNVSDATGLIGSEH